MDSKAFIIRTGQRTYRRILDWIYPPRCFGCQRYISCADDLFCPECGGNLRPVGPENQIQRLRQSEGIDQAYCGWYFTPEFQRGIHSLKYDDYAKFGFQLGRIMVDLLEPETWMSVDGLIPVPLHATKYRERGYNQSAWIARGIAKKTGIPVRRRLLKRIRNTRSQTTLSAEERRNNLENAFQVRGDVEGQTFIVVDDVLTTGSTISSAARSLKENGARTIRAVTLSTPE